MRLAALVLYSVCIHVAGISSSTWQQRKIYTKQQTLHLICFVRYYTNKVHVPQYLHPVNLPSDAASPADSLSTTLERRFPAGPRPRDSPLWPTSMIESGMWISKHERYYSTQSTPTWDLSISDPGSRRVAVLVSLVLYFSN